MTISFRTKALLAFTCLAFGLIGLAGMGAAHLYAAKRGIAPTTAKAPPVPLLWKVSDADNALYLLGSFHLLKPEDYPLSADIDAAFADAESVVFEISPAEMNSPELPQNMARAGTRGDGSILNSELSPATVERLKRWTQRNSAAMAKLQIDAQALQQFEPWFAGLLISLTEMSKLGLNPELGLDQHFGDRATAAGKRTAGLERAAEQIAFFDTMSKAEQIQFLEEALDSSEDGGEETLKMHTDWRKGDADALWRDMAVEFRRDYPALYRRINVLRNDAWLPKLEARLKQRGTDDTLVVVGSLHLLGDDGVVEKLRMKGYKVERVCAACKKTAVGGPR
jgi:uncharacterized protein